MRLQITKRILQLTIPLFFLPALSQAQTYTKVDTDLKTYDDTITAKNAAFNATPADPHNKPWVKAKLEHMVDVDQYMRNYLNTPFEHNYSNDEKAYFTTKFMPRWTAIDTQNTADLKLLLQIYNWFNISSFGAQSDQDAWLLVQHADLDLAFQKYVLAILEKLYPIGETNPGHYAYLFDRVAASWNDPRQRTLQRYGTQGTCTGSGTWAPIPTEDPANLDLRRQQVGLGSEADYIKSFKDICH